MHKNFGVGRGIKYCYSSGGLNCASKIFSLGNDCCNLGGKGIISEIISDESNNSISFLSVGDHGEQCHFFYNAGLTKLH